jgi:hypothetical protein
MLFKKSRRFMPSSSSWQRLMRDHQRKPHANQDEGAKTTTSVCNILISTKVSAAARRACGYFLHTI